MYPSLISNFWSFSSSSLCIVITDLCTPTLNSFMFLCGWLTMYILLVSKHSSRVTQGLPCLYQKSGSLQVPAIQWLSHQNYEASTWSVNSMLLPSLWRWQKGGVFLHQRNEWLSYVEHFSSKTWKNSRVQLTDAQAPHWNRLHGCFGLFCHYLENIRVVWANIHPCSLCTQPCKLHSLACPGASIKIMTTQESIKKTLCKWQPYLQSPGMNCWSIYNSVSIMSVIEM